MTLNWLVTGSARGLGRAIVETALEGGDRVLAAARNPERLDDLRQRYPDTLVPFAMDVTTAAKSRLQWIRRSPASDN